MKNKYKPLKLPNISLKAKDNHISQKSRNIYFLNSLKNYRIKKENFHTSLNNSFIKKNNKYTSIKAKPFSILNMSNKKTNTKIDDRNKNNIKIIPNVSFKNIYEIIKKNNLKRSASYNSINTIDKEKMNFESNFMKIKKESNIYTSNVNYIKNKKMLILDRYKFDNHRYKPDRLGLFDMSDFDNTKFRSRNGMHGHIYYNHNKYRRNIEDDSKYIE